MSTSYYIGGSTNTAPFATIKSLCIQKYKFRYFYEWTFINFVLSDWNAINVIKCIYFVNAFWKFSLWKCHHMGQMQVLWLQKISFSNVILIQYSLYCFFKETIYDCLMHTIIRAPQFLFWELTSNRFQSVETSSIMIFISGTNRVIISTWIWGIKPIQFKHF